ncbi:MAG: coniferyl aldehyde dehydrogenase [Alphaproteobacteria bacterium]|nr:coniferyl aldehyde dehydrogenase [Alphaproteobacteria bacterium]
MTEDDLLAAFGRQRAASRSHPAPDAGSRRRHLDMLADLVRTHAEAFASAISDDFGGRSHNETRMLELVPVMRGLRHARRHVGQWMRDEPRQVGLVFQPARAWVRYEPLGVIGIISPWNYPLLLALSPLIDALAAGNRVLLKPSELTPRFSGLLARAIAEQFSPDQVSVATGGADVASAFSALPFDHLLFTGSSVVGREVMRAAAANLTPLTLELGGKSPAIVAADYPVAKAAKSIAFGKFLNAGQTCIAPDYALVPQEEREAFAKIVIDAARRSYPALGRNDDYTAIITARHRDRLRDAVEEARIAGASILTHGGAGKDPAKFAPTIVLDPPVGCVLMREEIFGPVLPVIGYRDIGEAIAFAAARDRPLALYCFSNDSDVRRRVLDGVISGGVTLNGTLLHLAQENLPFGGIGPSGMGAYHGRDGFRRFSHARAIHQIGPINVFERLGPPWGKIGRRIGRWLS